MKSTLPIYVLCFVLGCFAGMLFIRLLDKEVKSGRAEISLPALCNQPEPKSGSTRVIIRFGQPGLEYHPGDKSIPFTIMGYDSSELYMISFAVPHTHPDAARLYELLKNGAFYAMTLSLRSENGHIQLNKVVQFG